MKVPILSLEECHIQLKPNSIPIYPSSCLYTKQTWMLKWLLSSFNVNPLLHRTNRSARVVNAKDGLSVRIKWDGSVWQCWKKTALTGAVKTSCCETTIHHAGYGAVHTRDGPKRDQNKGLERHTDRVRGGFQAQWPPALAGHTSIFFNGIEEALWLAKSGFSKTHNARALHCSAVGLFPGWWTALKRHKQL